RHVAGAEPRRSLGNRRQQRFEIESRAADDPEHIARRGLVFECLLQLAGALVQGALGLLAFGDVAYRADEPHCPGLLVADRDGAVLDPAILAVAQADAVLAVETECLAFQGGPQRRPIALKIIRMDAGVPFLARPLACVGPSRLPAKDLDQPRRYPERVAGDVPVVDAFGNG